MTRDEIEMRLRDEIKMRLADMDRRIDALERRIRQATEYHHPTTTAEEAQ